MNTDLISLPSGMIINLANVAFIVPTKGGTIRVVFNATYSIREAKPMAIELEADDSEAMIQGLLRLDAQVSFLRKAVKSNSKPAVDLDALKDSPAKAARGE